MLEAIFSIFMAVGLAQNEHCFPTMPADNCQCEYGQCYWWGDPHTRTFDGTIHHFQGNFPGWETSYRYVTPCTNAFNVVPFQVLATHYFCGTDVTCTDIVRLRLYNRFTGNFDRELQIDNWFDVQDVTNGITPLRGVRQWYAFGSSYMVTRTSSFVEIAVYTGILCPYWGSVRALPDLIVRVRYDMRWVFVQVNEYYFQLVCGLCGYWSGDSSDDFAIIWPRDSTSPSFCYQYDISGLPSSMSSYDSSDWAIVNGMGWFWQDVGNRRMLVDTQEPPEPPVHNVDNPVIDENRAAMAIQLCEELIEDAGDLCKDSCGAEVDRTCPENCRGEDCLRQCVVDLCTPACLDVNCQDEEPPDEVIENEC